MEYAQEQITTLHAFDDPMPPAPVGNAAVIVPLAERDCGTETAARTFETLAAVSPGRVIVALRAPEDAIQGAIEWLSQFDLDLTVLWCNAPAVRNTLAEAGVSAPSGKGRDVWLALGVASNDEYVVVHDADATSYDRTHVPRLLHPLANGFAFTKGYYARVEEDRLYGRLNRLFIDPLVQTLTETTEAAILDYLASCRYALAGEIAMTGELASRLRPPPGWGLELATLGDAFTFAQATGTAQVDLGMHRHDHRPVTGSNGLGSMANEVARTFFTVLESHDVLPDYETLPDRYQAVARRYIDQYAADARFNDLDYDRGAECAQVDRYRDAIAPPGDDNRLPAWRELTLDPQRLDDQSSAAIERHCGRIKGNI